MDDNKKKVLKQIEYQLSRNCANCNNSDIEKNYYYGTCKLHDYEHQKHTFNKRKLSIHRDGTCKDHVFQFGYDFGFFQAVYTHDEPWPIIIDLNS